MKYIPKIKEKRLILTVTKEEILSRKEFDEDDIIDVSRDLFTKWQKNQVCDFYTIDINVYRIAKYVNTKPFDKLPDSYVFRFVLGQGARNIAGIEIEDPIYPEYAMDISLKNIDCNSISEDDFYLNVMKISSKLGLQKPALAHCIGALHQMRGNYPPRILSILPEKKAIEEPYGFVEYGDKNICMFQIKEPFYLMTSRGRKEVTRYFNESIPKIEKERQFDFLINDFEAQLQLAGRGYDLFCVRPFTLFCGVTVLKRSGIIQKTMEHGRKVTRKKTKPSQIREKDVPKKPQPQQRQEQKNQVINDFASKYPNAKRQNILEKITSPSCLSKDHNYKGEGLIEVEVASDKMSCRIKSFDEAAFNNQEVKLDQRWIEKEMARLGLAVRNPKLIQTLLECLSSQKSIAGMVLCEGYMGRPPGEPYLVSLVPESKKGVSFDGKKGVAALRENKIHTWQKADRVAEYRFEEPGRLGWNIYGQRIPLIEPELPQIEVGEGVARTDDYGFIAKVKGILDLETDEKSINVSDVYVHNGNVNIHSGNIVFDGPVVIKGSIEENASVVCTGPLEVTGNVTQATIKSVGKTSVKCIMGSSVDIDGALTTQFLWDVDAVVSGTITVERSIVNSNCKVGGDIVIENMSGPLSGGACFIAGNLVCGDLGNAANISTKIYLGNDWRVIKRLAKYHKRKDQFTQILGDYEKRLQHLAQKRLSQLTKKDQQNKKFLEVSTTRIKAILDKVETFILRIQSNISHFNKDSEAKIRNVFYPNATIHFSRETVSTSNEITGVRVVNPSTNKRAILALPKRETLTKFR